MKEIFSEKSELVLVVSVVAILMLLFTPIPSGALDFLLLTNFCLALTILLLTFYTDKPLSFSTFPSLILIATLFRIGLNVSSTRLILSDADAGQVIGAIGSYVVGGNYVIGLVVFLILIVVQYVVVTNGAQRVAEVAARFTLDSMPGKQMSIDADLNMGLIDEHEAKSRRLSIEKEASFYGAMDGSTKFVKGDAIAGIIIILINIVGGLSIGVAQHNMSWSDALATFTLLTVGDGIVTQIPSLIVATATGIIITRAASDVQLGKELSRQITSQPKILILVACTMLGVLIMPGMPVLPIMLIVTFCLVIAYVVEKGRINNRETTPLAEEKLDDSTQDQEDDLYNLSKFEILELHLGINLHESLSVESSTLLARFHSFRKQFSLDFGLVLPQEKIIFDANLDASAYVLMLQGSRVARGDIQMDKLLAIDPLGRLDKVPGIKTHEPTYGLPALWIDSDSGFIAKKNGYTVVDPETTLLTHITETIKSNASEFLSRAETETIVSKLSQRHMSLVDDLIPSVMSYSEVQRVLQGLLKERVSIRNIPLILESLLDVAKEQKDSYLQAEYVRSKLKNQICQSLMEERDALSVMTMDMKFEQEVLSGINMTNGNGSLLLAPEITESLVKGISAKVEEMLKDRLKPVLLCSPQIRRHVFALCERVLPQLSVLSLDEIPSGINVNSFGLISKEA